MDFAQYLNGFKGKRVYFLGAGVSHKDLIPLFAKHGAKVTVCDKLTRDKFDPSLYRAFESAGVSFMLGEEYLLSLCDAEVVFRSPGISYFRDEIARAVKSGVRVTSEMEEFFEIAPCEIIGVTGSDGKTTTTTLISEILKAAGCRVFLGGNIGKPLLPLVSEMTKDDVAVVELSSFQLMSMRKSPRTALVTNIATNHLDYHADMGEYIDSKKNIYTHQTERDTLVLNADCPYCEKFASDSAAQKRFFSSARPVECGAYVKDGEIVLSTGEVVVSVDELLLRGAHNAANFAAACAALMGRTPASAMRSVALSFGGVAHRLELVRELSGVRYYNDSIATTPTRTIAGLRSFSDKLILIAGGYDKHIPFEPLVSELMRSVKLLILTGATADAIERAVETADGYDGTNPRICRAPSLEKAIAFAKIAAATGDEVLFSPACASFDSFKNFEERGDFFKKLVNSL